MSLRKILGIGRARSARTQTRNIFELQPLEQRLLFAFQAGVNFGPDLSVAPAGYVRDGGSVYGLRPSGHTFGWNGNNIPNVVERNVDADQRRDTFAHMQANGSFRWDIEVPNGTYQVKIVAGDPSGFDSVYKVNAESTLVVNGTPTTTNRFITGTANVTVSDGKLTLTSATGAVNNKLAYIDITDASRVASLPAQPTGLRATPASTTAIDLIWDDVADNDAGYKVERSATGTSGWTQIGTTFPSAPFYPNGGLTANTTYHYRVRATNAAGDSAYTSVVSATTRATTAQAAYNDSGSAWSIGATGTTIQAEDHDSGGQGTAYNDGDAGNYGGVYRAGSVDITRHTNYTNGYFVGWTKVGEWLEYSVNVPAAGTYALDVSVANNYAGGSFHVEFNGVDKTGMMAVPNTLDTNVYQTVSKNVTLSAGTQVVRVHADALDTSGVDVGNFNWFKLTGVVPAAPTGLSATATSTSQVNLSWTDTATNETGFKVERSADGSTGWAQVGTAGANVTTYSNTGLTANTTYYYRVRALNAGRESSPSNTASARTHSDAPAAPSNLAAVEGATTNLINVTWSDNATNETGYDVQRATDSNFTTGLTAFPALAANATSYADTTAAASTPYWYRVRAAGTGQSAWGTVKANRRPTIVNPPAASPAPVTGTTAALSVLGADDGGEAGLTYTWSVTAKPTGAATPTFSANGTNAAKAATATFSLAGSYTFQVSFSDGQLSKSATLSVAVEQTLTTVVLTPSAVSLSPNATQQFAAAGRDQFGNAMATAPTFAWAAANGGGSVSSGGLYAAPATSGTTTVRATSGPVSGTATVTVSNAAPVVSQPASATPNPVTSGTTGLAVRASDDGGEPGLTYTWSVTAMPAGAATPTFSVNGSNAAKDATATFFLAGSYTFQVSVSDGELSTVGTVDVLVNSLVVGGNIAGTVYRDADRDGSRDAGEPGYEGGLVYVDLNDSGTHQSGEPAMYTAADGTYAFAGLAAGTYVVRGAATSWWYPSLPADGRQVVVLQASQSASGVDFGYFDPYLDGPVARLANNGPKLEGGTVRVHFDSIVGSGPFTYSYDVNGDGDFADDVDIVHGTSPEALIAADDGPAASRVVAGRLTDVNGRSTQYTTQVTVQNVAPVAVIGGGVSLTYVGRVVRFGGSFTDASQADTAAGVTYAWTATKSGATYLSGSGATFEVPAEEEADYVVNLVVTDKDGGASSPATHRFRAVPSPVWYFNDFEQGNPEDWAEWSNAKRVVGNVPAHENVLGRFQGTVENPESTSLSWSLPEHTAVRVSFDVYIDGSWDGGGPYGGERFTAWVEGAQTLIQTGFRDQSGSSSWGQSYPNWSDYGNGAGSGGYNFSVGRIGGGTQNLGWHLSFVAPHSADTIKVNFKTFWPDGDGPERWALDNVRIEDASDQPLPTAAPQSVTAEQLPGSDGSPSSSVRVRWQPAPGAVPVGYHVYYGKTPNFDPRSRRDVSMFRVADSSVTEKTIDVPAVWDKVYFKVAAVSHAPQSHRDPAIGSYNTFTESECSTEVWIDRVVPKVTATPSSIVAAFGQSFTSDLVTFVDADSNAQAQDYTAMIAWGDASPVAAGLVSASADGTGFVVTGSHRYTSLAPSGAVPNEIRVVIVKAGFQRAVVLCPLSLTGDIVGAPVAVTAHEVPVQNADGTMTRGVSVRWQAEQVFGYQVFRFVPDGGAGQWKLLTNGYVDPTDPANLDNGRVGWLDKEATFQGAASYLYRVTAYEQTANGLVASRPTEVTATADLVGVSAPANVVASSYPQAIQLTWDDRPKVEDELWAGWNVYRFAAATQSWVRLNDAPITDLGWNDPGAPVGAISRYRVRTLDVFGNESEPVELHKRRSTHAEPPAPGGLTARPSGPGSVTVQWEPVVPVLDQGHTNDALAGYNVYRVKDGVRTKVAPSTSLHDAVFVDSGLVASSLYRYEVTAVDLDGDESVPAIISVRTGNNSVVAKPQNLTARIGFRPPPPGGVYTDRNVYLTWNSTLSTEVYRSTLPDAGFSPIGQGFRETTNGGTKADGLLRPGVRYYYRVYAVEPDGDWSEPATVDIQAVAAPNERPIVRLASPADVGLPLSLTADLPVHGLADDLNGDLQYWRLTLEPAGDGAGSLSTVTLSEGTGPIGDGVYERAEKLATISPTLLADGLYRLVLVAKDAAHPDPVRVQGPLLKIRSELKLGNFALPVTDLAVPLAGGQSIAVTRSYDTLHAATRGDFGYGWQQTAPKTGLRTTATKNVRDTSSATAYGLRAGDLVYITLPSGGQQTFVFSPEPLGWNRFGLYFTYKPRFVPVDGSSSTLTVPGQSDVTLVRDGDEYYNQETNRGFNPANTSGGTYHLTTVDRTLHVIRAASGKLEYAQDLNGNRVNYADGAVTDAFGAGVTITRYPTEAGPARAGLIKEVRSTAPGALPVEYEYDDQGRLALVRDRAGDETQYRYEDVAHPNFITAVVDARGITVIEVEYDAASGAVKRLTDISGKGAPLTGGGYDGVSANRTVTDLAGNDTEFVYDPRGNVTREIRTVRTTPGGAVTGYNVTVHAFSHGVPTAEEENGHSLFNVLIASRASHPFFVPVAKQQLRYAPPTELANDASLNFRWAASRDYHINAGREHDNPDFRQLLSETVYLDGGGTRTTLYRNYKLGRPQVVVQRVWDPAQSKEVDYATSYMKYDDAGNLEWTANTLGEGSRFTYTDGGTAGVPAGLPWQSFRVTVTNPAAAFDGDATTNPTVVDLSPGQADSTTTYYGSGAPAGSQGRVRSTTDAAGATVAFAYDAAGNPALTATLWDNPASGQPDRWVVSESVFDDSGRAVESAQATYADGGTADELGWSLMNGKPAVTEPVIAARRVLGSTQYDLLGNVGSSVDQYLGASTNHYDDRGNLIETIGPDGTRMASVYDLMGRVILSIDRFVPGQADPIQGTRTLYDVLGRVVERQRVSGITVTVARLSPTSEVYRVTAVGGAGIVDDPTTTLPGVWQLDAAYAGYLSRTRTVYDGAGRVIETVAADGFRSGTLYYDDGRTKHAGRIVVSATAPSQRHVAYPAVANGYLVEYASYAYDGLEGGVLFDSVTDALAHTTKTYKDVLGRPVRTAFHDGSFTETLYSIAGQAVAGQAVIPGSPAIGAGSRVTSIEQRKTSDLTIVATDRFYDASGRLTDVYLPAVLDADPSSPTYNQTVRPRWHYTYDANGNQLTQVDPKGRVTRFTYDEQGRRTGRTLPAVNGVTVSESTEYDAFGRVEYSTDFNGNQATYHYDALGRVDAERWFDPGDNVATATSDIEYVTTYDTLGRVDTVTEKRAGVTVDVTDTDYDPVTGAIARVATTNGTIQYAHSPATGRKTDAWTADNHTSYDYDVQGRLWHVTQSEFNGVASNLVTTYEYDAAGNLNWMTLPNGVKEDYGYDDLNRLTSLVVTQSDGDKLFEQAYTLESDGQRDYVIEKRYNGTSSSPFNKVKVDWAYDGLNRLTSETRDEDPTPADLTDNFGTRGGDDYTDTYAFDLANNRVGKRHGWDANGDRQIGTGEPLDEAITYTVDARDRLSTEDSTVAAHDSAYNYDDNGSTVSVTKNGTTQKYIWDQRNRMTGFDANGDGDTTDAGDATYTYDQNGIRTSAQVVGQTPAYYLLDSRNPTGYPKAVQQSATRGGAPTLSYILAADVVAQSDGTNIYHLVKDGHGTTRALMNKDGEVVQTYDFDAFGNKVHYADAWNASLAGNPATVWLMPDGYRDGATGLDRNGVRDVASRLGRLWSFDSYFGTAEDPKSLHKYLYANASPANYSDPSGLMSSADLLSAMKITMGQIGTRSYAVYNVYDKVDTIVEATKLAAMFVRSGNADPIALAALLVEFTPLGKVLPKSWVDGKAIRGLTETMGGFWARVRLMPSRKASQLLGEFGGGVVARKLGLSATDFNPRHTGIDGVFRDPSGRLVILEAKGGNSHLGMTKHGEQLSPQWIDRKIVELKALNDPWGEALEKARDSDNLDVIMTRVPRDADSIGDPLFERMQYNMIPSSGGWTI